MLHKPLSAKLSEDLLQSSSSYFSDSYQISREQFLSQFDAYNGEKQAWFCPLASNLDAQLGTDVICLGQQTAANVLVFMSGTHGVEGFCGSAIQQFYLKQLSPENIPADTAIVMIHSLNPWGMYWARRCDQSGIDLNRNFVDYRNVPDLDPNYDAILDTLMRSSNRYQEMQRQCEQWGQQDFDRIFSGGQYVHKWAPFYGGNAPAHGRKVIEQVILQFELASKNTRVIDLHTGLGPWAFGELICDHPVNSNGHLEAVSVFGPAIANAHQGDSFSVPKLGLLDYGFHPFMNEKGFFLTLEFGTYGSAALFEVLLNDHVFWRDQAPAQLDEPNYQVYRERMIEHFCPKQALWQQAVLFKAWQVLNHMLQD
ncbi:MAG: DUF2817 domain-containing protein [Oleiphilus sp.]